MRYKNKNTMRNELEMAKRAGGTLNRGTGDILSKVKSAAKKKLNKPASLTRILARKQGKVSGMGQNEQEKTIEKIEDKTLGKTSTSNNPNNIKVREDLYKDMSIKNPKALRILALTDPNAKKFLELKTAGV